VSHTRASAWAHCLHNGAAAYITYRQLWLGLDLSQQLHTLRWCKCNTTPVQLRACNSVVFQRFRHSGATGDTVRGQRWTSSQPTTVVVVVALGRCTRPCQPLRYRSAVVAVRRRCAFRRTSVLMTRHNRTLPREYSLRSRCRASLPPLFAQRDDWWHRFSTRAAISPWRLPFPSPRCAVDWTQSVLCHDGNDIPLWCSRHASQCTCVAMSSCCRRYVLLHLRQQQKVSVHANVFLQCMISLLFICVNKVLLLNV